MKLPDGMTFHVHGKKFKGEVPDNLLSSADKKMIEKKLSGGVKKPDGNFERTDRKRSE